jgi:hypothetical protein
MPIVSGICECTHTAVCARTHACTAYMSLNRSSLCIRKSPFSNKTSALYIRMYVATYVYMWQLPARRHGEVAVREKVAKRVTMWGRQLLRDPHVHVWHEWQDGCLKMIINPPGYRAFVRSSTRAWGILTCCGGMYVRNMYVCMYLYAFTCTVHFENGCKCGNTKEEEEKESKVGFFSILMCLYLMSSGDKIYKSSGTKSHTHTHTHCDQ